jgi:acyl-CoA thioesterase II
MGKFFRKYLERSGHLADTKIRYWFRTKETIPKESGHRAHLAALAYMSDAYLIVAAVEAHGHIPILTYPIRFSMIASLNHTIYFHNPKAVQVDQWMCSERESPWTGDNRGLVIQSIWSHEGVLIATCVQEVSFSILDTLFKSFLLYVSDFPGRDFGFI